MDFKLQFSFKRGSAATEPIRLVRKVVVVVTLMTSRRKLQESGRSDVETH